MIQSVKESTVIVKVDELTKMEFSRSAISGVETQAKEEKADSGRAEKEEKKPALAEPAGAEAEGKKD